MERPLHARVLVALGVLLASSTLLVRLADMDLFSHVAVGRWILAHHAIPTTDPFSYASAGPFRYTEALADVIFAGIDARTGAVGLSLFQIAVGVALLALVLARSPGSAAARVLVVALVVAASFAAMTLKPQVFSYLIFAAILVVVDRAPSRSERGLLLLPLFFLAWANLHRGGVFGLAALGAVAVGFAFDPATRPHAKATAIATVLSAAALLVNSGGVFYFTSAFDVVGRASFHKYIDEWRPLTFATVRDRHLAILPLLALALGERAARRRKIDPELLVLLLTCALATRGARLIPFVAIAAAPAAVRAVDAIATRGERFARRGLMDGLILIVGFALPPLHYDRTVATGYRGLGVCTIAQPVELGEFLAAHRPPGHLFHAFNFGGWFVYALAPETKVLIDGRNDTVYDDAHFQAVIEAETSPAAFAALDRRFELAVAAFDWSELGDARGAFLLRDPAWTLIYWDDLSVVYANRARAAAMVDAIGYRALRVDTVLARATHPTRDDGDALFMTELHRNATDAPRSVRAHYLLAIALAARGARDEAQRESAMVEVIAKEKGLPIASPF